MTRFLLALLLAATGVPATTVSATPTRETAFPAMSEEALAPKVAPAGYDVTVIVFSDSSMPERSTATSRPSDRAAAANSS